MQYTHGNCRDFTLKRRRSRSVGARGGFLMRMRCGLLAALRGAEADALFGLCAASELYRDEVKQPLLGRAVASVVSSEADQGDA